MPDDSKLADDLIRALRQFRHVTMGGMKPIEGCTPSESVMLFVIRRFTLSSSEGIKASDLSHFLRVSSPTVTQQVNLLEARGLLERAADPADRRVVRIRLTEEGIRLTEIAGQAMNASVQSLIAHMGENRVEQLIELLDEVYRFYNDKAELSDFCRPPSAKPNE